MLAKVGAKVIGFLPGKTWFDAPRAVGDSRRNSPPEAMQEEWEDGTGLYRKDDQSQAVTECRPDRKRIEYRPELTHLAGTNAARLPEVICARAYHHPKSCKCQQSQPETWGRIIPYLQYFLQAGDIRGASSG